MKVLIGDDWEEFEVEFKEPHPDGGVRIECETLRRECGEQIHFPIIMMIIVYDTTDEEYSLLSIYPDYYEGYEIICFDAVLSSEEQNTYTVLI